MTPPLRFCAVKRCKEETVSLDGASARQSFRHKAWRTRQGLWRALAGRVASLRMSRSSLGRGHRNGGAG